MDVCEFPIAQPVESLRLWRWGRQIGVSHHWFVDRTGWLDVHHPALTQHDDNFQNFTLPPGMQLSAIYASKQSSLGTSSSECVQIHSFLTHLFEVAQKSKSGDIRHGMNARYRPKLWPQAVERTHQVSARDCPEAVIYRV